MNVRKSKLVIFDLDGTLIDSRLDITNSVNHALKHVGLPTITVKEATYMIGGGTRSLIQKATSAHPERFKEAFAIFSEHYGKHLLDHTVLYPGVHELLQKLDGRAMAVMSNKRQRFCDPIIDGLGVRNYFRLVVGGDIVSKKKPDPEPILHICEKLGIAPEQTSMVGDSPVDIAAGKAAGAHTVGLTEGFNSPESVREANPDIVTSNLQSLLDLI